MRSVRALTIAGTAAVFACTLVAAVLVEAARAESQPPGTGLPDTGQALFQQDCAVCHGPRGEGSFRGPPINESGQAAVSFMVTTGRMPATSIDLDTPRQAPKYSPEQIDALLAYTSQFVTGPPIPDVGAGDAATGGEVYRLNCASCHQAVGAGGALAYGTTAPALNRATPVQVVEAMRIGPGSMPAFAPSQIDDNAAANVAAYVAYLRHPDDRGGFASGHFGPVPEGFVAWLFGLGALVLFVRWLGTRQRFE